MALKFWPEPRGTRETKADLTEAICPSCSEAGEKMKTLSQAQTQQRKLPGEKPGAQSRKCSSHRASAHTPGENCSSAKRGH